MSGKRKPDVVGRCTSERARMAATVVERSVARVVPVRIVFRPEDDHWAAVAPEYSIVGVGETPEVAYERIGSALQEYFDRCSGEGLSLQQARRPIRGRWRAEVEAWQMLWRLAGVMHRARRPREVPVSLHGRLAGC